MVGVCSIYVTCSYNKIHCTVDNIITLTLKMNVYVTHKVYQLVDGACFLEEQVGNSW